MLAIRSLVRDSLRGLSRPAPLAATPCVGHTRRQHQIRDRMLQELLTSGIPGVATLAWRIRTAPDAWTLWYQRTELMQVLAPARGEARAAALLAEITRLFDGLLPATVVGARAFNKSSAV